MKNLVVERADCGCVVSLHSKYVASKNVTIWVYRFRGTKCTEGKPYYLPAFDKPENPLVTRLKAYVKGLGYKSHVGTSHEWVLGLKKAGEIFEGEAGAYLTLQGHFASMGLEIEAHQHDEYKVSDGKDEALVVGERFGGTSYVAPDGSPYLGGETTFSIRLPNRGEWALPSEVGFWATDGYTCEGCGAEIPPGKERRLEDGDVILCETCDKWTNHDLTGI